MTMPYIHSTHREKAPSSVHICETKCNVSILRPREGVLVLLPVLVCWVPGNQGLDHLPCPELLVPIVLHEGGATPPEAGPDAAPGFAPMPFAIGTDVGIAVVVHAIGVGGGVALWMGRSGGKCSEAQGVTPV